MKLDLLYEIDVPKPWPGEFPENQRTAEQHAYREAMEQIRLADTLGFNTVWLVEHHFREGRSHSSAPEVTLGYLAAATQNLRLGFGVTLLPPSFRHPAMNAERVATLDVLSGGRVEWGTGRSTPMEQTAFGVPIAESREQWEEAIQTVVEMWENEYYECDKKYTKFPRRMVTPKPVQYPHPPAWMAATSEGSSAVAGSLGLGLLTFAIMQPVDKLASHIRQYRDAAQNANPITRTRTNKVAAYTLVHCAESMDQAEANGVWDSVWWWYQNLSEFTIKWELPHLPKEEQEKAFPLLKKHAEGNLDPKLFNDVDMIIVGDPERCLEKFLKYESIGCDQVLCYVQFGHLPHDSVMRTIELLGKEVIPQLEKRGIETSMTVKASGS